MNGKAVQADGIRVVGTTWVSVCSLPFPQFTARLSGWKPDLIGMVAEAALVLVLLPASLLAGRTTNKFFRREDGGFHHHGGFLGGYFDFYRG